MEDKSLNQSFTAYDLQGITELSKKRVGKIVLQISLYTLFLVLSILAIVLLGEYLWVFIIGIAVACISAFMCAKQFRKISFLDCSISQGEIADVLKESTTVRSITGGYGMYVTRKYDAFAKAAIRLTVSLKNEDEVHSYVLEGVTEEHSNYYEAKGEAIHIWGTHFPVKLEIGKEKWLCPICGTFNEKEEKTCLRCKARILK